MKRNQPSYFLCKAQPSPPEFRNRQHLNATFGAILNPKMMKEKLINVFKKCGTKTQHEKDTPSGAEEREQGGKVPPESTPAGSVHRGHHNGFAAVRTPVSTATVTALEHPCWMGNRFQWAGKFPNAESANSTG